MCLVSDLDSIQNFNFLFEIFHKKGNDKKKIEKSSKLNADCTVVDCEGI